ncbi:MAG: hypothetical protein ACRDRL_16290 [Sciscionella sp.]
MPTHLPASGAHVLWVVAVVAVTNIAVRTWAGNHPQSAVAQALAYVF